MHFRNYKIAGITKAYIVAQLRLRWQTTNPAGLSDSSNICLRSRDTADIHAL